MISTVVSSSSSRRGIRVRGVCLYFNNDVCVCVCEVVLTCLIGLLSILFYPRYLGLNGL